MSVRWMAGLSIGLVLALGTVGAQPPAQSTKTEKQVRSYALGMDLGAQLRKLGIDVDPAVFAKGLADALSGEKTEMTADEGKQAIARLQNELKTRQMLPPAASADIAKQAEDNRKAGEAFLAANARKEGVVTLPSGVQYRVITQGTGRKPALGDQVVCQYRGTLVDGTEFDSSYARNQAATLAVSGVIPGWSEALQLMPVGSKWQLVIPAARAYGAAGYGDKIGPHATLVFEVELLSIK